MKTMLTYPFTGSRKASRIATDARVGRHAKATVGALLAAALMPKCPLCVVVWLTGLGASAAWASQLAPLVRPFLFAIMLGPLVLCLSVLTGWRRSYRVARARPAEQKPLQAPDPAASCCDHR